MIQRAKAQHSSMELRTRTGNTIGLARESRGTLLIELNERGTWGSAWAAIILTRHQAARLSDFLRQNA